ncbi:Protein Jade-3 [Nymphon striatum]|nr:Protein Jade-3 [Nymphon striatum]
MSSHRMKRLFKEWKDMRGGKATKKKRPLSGSEDEHVKGSSRLMCDYVPHTSNIYNSATGKKPAELFRKDLISAMKLPDSEQLDPKEYLIITDQWKPEWEKGVQVPVNPDSLPEISVREVSGREIENDFKMPKKLMSAVSGSDLYAGNDGNQVCRYDMDLLDDQWLRTFNEERQLMGLEIIEEDKFENVIEKLEINTYDNLQLASQNELGLGIEYDEDVICDVCRSPDSEDGNEMVFCDSCDICVHQACYGITLIPSGSWMCKTCTLGYKPQCLFCPKRGGAMKPVKNGNEWAHVSCALWIPEVSIGCVEKMEPITKINQIPSSRWSLLCSQCKEKYGACIQCSVKTCKTAYHVTCAFKDCLEMKAILVGNKDGPNGVKLRSYCHKHSQKNDKPSSPSNMSDSDSDNENRSNDMEKKKYSMSEEKNSSRNARIKEMENEFYKYIRTDKIADILKIDKRTMDFIFQYWKLKRIANFTKPLLRPEEVEMDLFSKQQEDSLYEKMKMFVHIRQDLERVRNLCYMVIRRAKLSKSYSSVRSNVFDKQNLVLTDDSLKLSGRERQLVIDANHADNMYDIHYSQTQSYFRNVTTILSSLSPKTDKVRKTLKITEPNPYAKQYTLNAVIKRTHRRSLSSISSESVTSTSIVKKEGDLNDHSPNSSMLSTEMLEDEENKYKNDIHKSEIEISDTLAKPNKRNCQTVQSEENNRLNNLKCKTQPLRLNKQPKSFESPKRQELREVNAKIRASIMFSNSLLPKSTILRGYKIPKKCRTESPSFPTTSDIELKKEIKTDDDNLLDSASQNGSCNGDVTQEEHRLVLKLKKDPNFSPESSHWRNESSSSSDESQQSSPGHTKH